MRVSTTPKKAALRDAAIKVAQQQRSVPELANELATLPRPAGTRAWTG